MVPFAKPLMKLAGLESIATYQKQKLKEDRAYKNMCLSHGPHPCSHIRYHTAPRFKKRLRLVPRGGSVETIVSDRPARKPPWRLRFPGSRHHFEEYDLHLDNPDYDHSCRPDKHLRLILPPPRQRQHLHPELRPHHRDRGGDLESYSEFSDSDYEFDYMTDGETDFEILSTTSPGSYVRRRPRFHDSVWDDRHHGHPVHAHHRNDYDYHRYTGWEDDTVHGRGMDGGYGDSARHGYRAGRRDSYLADPYETDIEDDLETL